MKLFSILCVALALIAQPAYAAGKSAPAQRDQIAAVVNDEAVSIPDIEARMKLIMVSSGMPNTPEFKDKIRPQILNMLIDEQLRLQAAAKLKIEVDPKEVDEGFATIASQNNFTPEKFRQILKNERIPARTLEDQIRAQIAWSKVVEKKLKPEIDVSESDIDTRIQLFSANMGKNLYLVSEIFLPVDSAQQEGEVKQLADRLSRQLTEQKAPFPKVAMQFSQSAGASKGGDMGWVQQGQLQPELDSVLATMKEGDMTRPIRSPTGYHILLLRKIQTVSQQAIPPRNEIGNQIGTERLDRAQRRYLMDLKAAAFVERRV